MFLVKTGLTFDQLYMYVFPHPAISKPIADGDFVFREKLYFKNITEQSEFTISHILLITWKLLIQLMHASKGILNLPTSSVHLCSPFQQDR